MSNPKRKILTCAVLLFVIFTACSSCRTMEGMPQSIIVEPKNVTPEKMAELDSITKVV